MSDSLTSSTRKVNQPSIEEHQPQPSEQQEEQPQQLDEMPGAANGRLSHHKKSVCPTVTYLNIFPEAGDQFKANENGDGHMQPSRALRQETLHTGKYLELTKYHFQDSTGNERTAEGVHMVKQVLDQKPRHVKGVIDIPTKLGNLCTIAVLKKQIMCDALVLTKQYRAPLRAYTIEFPATVIEKGSVPRDLAAKEIADDTGYSSTSVQYISPLTSLEPDISDGKLQFVSLTIDGDDPLQHPNCNNNNQSHDSSNGAHGDIVEVLKVPVNGLIERLEKYHEAGYVIDSRVIAFAIGLRAGSALLKTEAVIENESPA